MRSSPCKSCLFLRLATKQKLTCFNRKFSLSSSSSQLAPPPNSSRFSWSKLTGFEKAKLEEYDNQQVGITEFIASPPRVVSIIKKRASDFQVHEIDQNGNIVKLTDLSPPDPPNLKGEDEDATQFLECTLYKESIEHYDAQTLIAKKLGIKTNEIKYAGRKDRWAQTSQRISIANPHRFNIQQLDLNSTTIKLGNFTYTSQLPSNGQRKGNHFKILLRNILLETNDDDKHIRRKLVETSIKSLRDIGFINYFGLQRFGINNHEAGLAILQNNWEQVFDVLLHRFPTDQGYVSKLKYLWKVERDPIKMWDCIPLNERDKVNELIRLVHGLATHYQEGKGNLLAAFQTIPMSFRSIHLSSFTSYLWNHAVSFRIKKFGLRVLPGDFVYPSQTPLFVDGVSGQRRDVKMLTEEDLVEGHPYSIYDVLLPFMGSQVTAFGVPELEEYRQKFLISHGLAPDCFSTFELSDELQKGFYRHVMIKPQNVDYKIITYNHKTDWTQFMPSDLDLLKIHETGSQEVTKDDEDLQDKRDQNVDVLEDKLGVIVEFSLPTSAYATMALREVTMNSYVHLCSVAKWKIEQKN